MTFEKHGPQDPRGPSPKVLFCNADVFCSGVCIQYTIVEAIVFILLLKADSCILAIIWKMIFARGLTISVLGKWSLWHCFIIRLKWSISYSSEHFRHVHGTRRKVDQSSMPTLPDYPDTDRMSLSPVRVTNLANKTKKKHKYIFLTYFGRFFCIFGEICFDISDHVMSEDLYFEQLF